MPRTRSVAWSELKLGVVGVVAMVLVVILIVAVGGQGGFFWQRYPVKTQFSQINGLKTGAVVRLSGMEIGKVTRIEFQGSQVEVVMDVSKNVRQLITTDSVATMSSLGLLGEPLVEIQAATSGTPIADWGYIKATQRGGIIGGLTASMTENLDKAGRLVDDVRAGRGTLGKLVVDQALYDEMERFATSAANVTRAIDQGRGTLGALSKDPAAYEALKTSLENLRTMTARINSGEGPLGRLVNDEAFGKSLAGTTSNAEQITARLNRGEGTAGKLLTDQQLYDQLRSVTSRVDALVSGLDEGRGTAGQLVRDQRLYENMNEAATELRGLLADIRKDPKKYLRVSVSIF